MVQGHRVNSAAERRQIRVGAVGLRRYAEVMAVRLHRLTSRLGAEVGDLTRTHLQQLCDLRMPEDVDLDFKGQDAYTTSPDGLDELAKDVTALANARGGLIIVGIAEDTQGCADSLTKVAVSDKKIGQMTGGLRARVIPWLPDLTIRSIEDAPGSGDGYILIAVGASPIAPHPVRMTSRPQYSYARRVGRTTAWLEESEIAALYRDRFRLAEDHREAVLKVLETGSEWMVRTSSVAADRVYLDLALVPSVPAERFVDPAHISGLAAFFSDHSKPGAAPRAVFHEFVDRRPAVLRGRLRLEPFESPTAGELYADGRVFPRTEVGWPVGYGSGASHPVLNLTGLEYWLLVLLQAAAKYSEWAGAYGDVDIVTALVGPTTIVPDLGPASAQFRFTGDPKERTDTEPVHATSTLDALTGDANQLVESARRIAADLIADFGYIETTLVKPNGRILSTRLDPRSRAVLESWMHDAGLQVEG
jgi:hypothetical protein